MWREEWTWPVKEALRAERMDSREVSPFTSIPAAARAAAASSADMLSIPASAIASSDAATPGSLRPSRSFYRRLIQAAGGASASRAVRALANRRHVLATNLKKTVYLTVSCTVCMAVLYIPRWRRTVRRGAQNVSKTLEGLTAWKLWAMRLTY